MGGGGGKGGSPLHIMEGQSQSLESYECVIECCIACRQRGRCRKPSDVLIAIL